MSQKRFLAKLLWYSTFVISAVLSLSLNVTGSAIATTGEIGVVRHFVASPNGKKILFVSETSDAEDHSWASVMLLDLASEKVVGLTGEMKHAELSPDGKFIAYIENDSYYWSSLVVMTSDGRELKLYYHNTPHHFSQLRWSKDSKYLTFFSDGGATFGKETVVISPQIRVVPDELAKVEWQEPRHPFLGDDHPLYQKKPTVKADSIVLWGDDKTIYVQAVDGIWQGSLDEPFIVRWRQLVEAKDIEGSQAINLSPQGTHLLYNRVVRYSDNKEISSKSIWILPLKPATIPVKIAGDDRWVRAQFIPNGQNILVYDIGLWLVSLDGSSKRKLTRQKSLP